jgi:hypothetical protein
MTMMTYFYVYHARGKRVSLQQTMQGKGVLQQAIVFSSWWSFPFLSARRRRKTGTCLHTTPVWHLFVYTFIVVLYRELARRVPLALTFPAVNMIKQTFFD